MRDIFFNQTNEIGSHDWLIRLTKAEQSDMLKNKSIDYIFGMITGASLMVAFWTCTSDVTASGSDVQQVEIVNGNRYLPVYVEVVN